MHNLELAERIARKTAGGRLTVKRIERRPVVSRRRQQASPPARLDRSLSRLSRAREPRTTMLSGTGSIARTDTADLLHRQGAQRRQRQQRSEALSVRSSATAADEPASRLFAESEIHQAVQGRFAQLRSDTREAGCPPDGDIRPSPPKRKASASSDARLATRTSFSPPRFKGLVAEELGSYRNRPRASG